MPFTISYNIDKYILPQYLTLIDAINIVQINKYTKYLINKSTIVNHHGFSTYGPILHKMYSVKNITAAELLIKAGANVNTQDKSTIKTSQKIDNQIILVYKI
jgi:hypothetical protein